MPHRFWSTEADAAAFLDGGGTALIFKHSSRCSISGMIRPIFLDWLEAQGADVHAFEIGVVEYRPASNLVAERLGVQHESPQAILVKNGKAMWNASHLRITADALDAAWAAHGA